ncbi:MAG TPA: VOC family protein, partial [Marmoricola sp.]|nr:VOC family protein [Marmoricola sp.]
LTASDRRRERKAMNVELNHTIVHVKDRWTAAREVAATLGRAEPAAYGPFAVLELDNGVSLDFMETAEEIHAQHYAFLVGDQEFDAIHARLRDAGRSWWADPHKRQPAQVNHGDGGRGLYWEGPDGHWLEIITRPYGSGG